MGKLVVNTLMTMVENLKWKSESGEREGRETLVEVREKERGESVLLKSEAKTKRKVGHADCQCGLIRCQRLKPLD